EHPSTFPSTLWPPDVTGPKQFCPSDVNGAELRSRMESVKFVVPAATNTPPPCGVVTCPEPFTTSSANVLSTIAVALDFENSPPPCAMLVPEAGSDTAVAASPEIVEFWMVDLLVALVRATPPPWTVMVL